VRRRGFTLLEAMVALAVTGLVAVLVYGVASVATDTERRLRREISEGRAERAWRALLEDALRNTRPAPDYRRPTLRIEAGPRGPGGPLDVIRFTAAGGTPPLTSDADWEIVVEAVDGRLALTATPIGVVAPARRVLAPPGITGLEVRALDAIGNRGWQEEWSQGYLPRALALTYWGAGRALSSPAHVVLPMGVAP
jgi:prepilin-type N-terminal cleavage/methylation domain-containing protein